MFDRQDAFNRAVAAMVKQGLPAINNDDHDTCMYRTPNGLKCAIGHLISDDDYNEDMEFKTVANSTVYKALGLDASDQEDIGFLCALQTCHDSSSELHEEGFFIKEFLKLAKIVATNYHLEMPNITA